MSNKFEKKPREETSHKETANWKTGVLLIGQVGAKSMMSDITLIIKKNKTICTKEMDLQERGLHKKISNLLVT